MGATVLRTTLFLSVPSCGKLNLIMLVVITMTVLRRLALLGNRVAHSDIIWNQRCCLWYWALFDANPQTNV